MPHHAGQQVVANAFVLFQFSHLLILIPIGVNFNKFPLNIDIDDEKEDDELIVQLVRPHIPLKSETNGWD